MKIDLKEIGASGISIERRIPSTRFNPDEASAGPALRVRGEARLEVAVRRTGERFHLRGRLEADVEIACDRCLGTFDIAVRPEFDYYLVPRRPVDEWAEVEIDETARREVEVDRLELDLLHLAREQVRLGLPMKALCRDDCRGLCSGCGADLNREDCRCQDDSGVDGPGLAALAGLLKRMKDDDPGT
jgi:uncharacterized protein